MPAAVEKEGVGTSVLVLLLVIFLVLAAVLNNVFSKLAYDAFGMRYSFFVNQASNAVYLCVATSVVLYKTIFRPDDITPAMRKLSFKRPLLIMGTLDATAGFLGAQGSVGTPGSYQILLNQTLIPITMLVSFAFLRHRYSIGEICAAAVIVVGAGLAVAPDLVDGKSSSHVVWYAFIVFVSGNIPNALSSVYKEYSLKGDVRLDMFYLTMWVACFQTLVTFLYLPLQGIPGFGGFPLKEIIPLLWDGLRCAGGINSHEGDQCETLRPILYFTCYTVANFAYNVLGLMITMRGSAALAALSYTLQIPATSVIFALCGLMSFLHEDCEPFTVWSAIGMALVLVGFLLHSWFERRASLSQAQKELDATGAGSQRNFEVTPLLDKSVNERPNSRGYGQPFAGDHADRVRRRWVQSAISRATGRDGQPSTSWFASGATDNDSASLADNWYFSKLPDFTTGGLTQAIAIPESRGIDSQFHTSTLGRSYGNVNRFDEDEVDGSRFGSAPV